MKPLRHFEEYIEEGIVKRQNPDFPRAVSLAKDAGKSYLFLNKIVKEFLINNENANTIVKLAYDILMDLIRAKMLEKGYNTSGQGAHESEVSYLRELRFNENDIQFCDQLRYFRNGIMYYGKILEKEYAEKVWIFLNKIYPKLK